MHVCDTWSFSAISRVVLWRSESSSTSTEIRNYLVANPIVCKTKDRGNDTRLKIYWKVRKRGRNYQCQGLNPSQERRAWRWLFPSCWSEGPISIIRSRSRRVKGPGCATTGYRLTRRQPGRASSRRFLNCHKSTCPGWATRPSAAIPSWAGRTITRKVLKR